MIWFCPFKFTEARRYQACSVHYLMHKMWSLLLLRLRFLNIFLHVCSQNRSQQLRFISNRNPHVPSRRKLHLVSPHQCARRNGNLPHEAQRSGQKPPRHPHRVRAALSATWTIVRWYLSLVDTFSLALIADRELYSVTNVWIRSVVFWDYIMVKNT